MKMRSTRWTRRYAGFYTLDGTDYGVASSFASPSDKGTGSEWAGSGSEWAVIRKAGGRFTDHNDGENVDWYDTMREARARAEQLAAR